MNPFKTILISVLVMSTLADLALAKTDCKDISGHRKCNRKDECQWARKNIDSKSKSCIDYVEVSVTDVNTTVTDVDATAEIVPRRYPLMECVTGGNTGQTGYYVGESSDDHVFKLHKGVRNGVAKLSYKDWNCECDEITKAIVLLAGKDQISSSCYYGVVEIGVYQVSVQLDNGTWIRTFPGECESVAAVLNTYQEIQEVGTVSCSYGELGVKAGDGDCTATAAAITQLIDANTPVWNESTCRRQDPGPIPVPVTWVEKQGCCRQKKGDRTHHDTATVHMLPKSSKSKAVAACKQKCEEIECSAYEVHKAGKKKNKKFKCETHVAAIDSATRRSKSCKKSQCFFPQV